MLTTSTRQVTGLAILPETLTFTTGDEQEAQFIEALQEQHRATAVQEIRHPRDVMLDAAAQLPAQRLYTTTALGQVCKLLAPGLGLLLDNLTGRLNRRVDGKEMICDRQLAIRTFNDLVRLRFNQLEGYSLLTDSRHRRVDGILSRRYQRLSNYDLYIRSHRFIRNRQPGMKFHEAACCGRRMMLRYCDSQQLFAVHPLAVPAARQDAYRRGFHFANSEVGECALRISTLLVRLHDDSKAIGGYTEGGRLIHVRGPKFEEGFQVLLSRAQKKAADPASLQTHAQRLIDVNLGLGKNAEQHRLRMANLLTQLTRAGLPKRFATQVLSRAIAVGSYADRPSPQTAALMVQRTAYDVFTALIWQAKAESLDLRERAEQLAYQLLLDKLHLK